MKRNFTLSKSLPQIFLSIFLVAFAFSVSAQSSCTNERVIWMEDFGAGTVASSSPDVQTLVYQATGSLQAEGVYRIINNTQQKPEWHASADHTGNTEGKMLVTNGQAETFYQHIVTDTHGFTEGTYYVGMWAMNVNTPGTCGAGALLPVFRITVEYLSADNVWTPLAGSPYTAAPMTQSATPTWVNFSSYFNIGSFGTFLPTKFRITLSDGTTGGCGNDFAMDDIKLSECPEGGPMPVTFVDVTAKQKGSGVSIDWSTSQEINNDHFEVERSNNGNSGWEVIATVNGAGNSNLQQNYNAFDASPLSGQNFYRVSQVDKDGKSSFSKTVKVSMENISSRVSVLANPFHSTLGIKFSGNAQQVVVRLIDITGKQLAHESWNIENGETTRQFTNLPNLQKGLYILSVQNKAGEMLYNGKVMKQ